MAAAFAVSAWNAAVFVCVQLNFVLSSLLWALCCRAQSYDILFFSLSREDTCVCVLVLSACPCAVGVVRRYVDVSFDFLFLFFATGVSSVVSLFALLPFGRRLLMTICSRAVLSV